MLTWAMPVTVMLTPWEVYTAELVTVSVIVFRDILQPPTRFTLYFIVFYFSATFLSVRFTVRTDFINFLHLFYFGYSRYIIYNCRFRIVLQFYSDVLSRQICMIMVIGDSFF